MTPKSTPTMNATLFCLIPKCPNTTMLKNFRSITVWNTIYKNITKIVINRIKHYLPDIIGPSQNNLMSNKRASDNAIIYQEYITHFKKMKGKNANTILKIDLKKVFDRHEWSFIRDTLHGFNFFSTLIKHILSCFSSTSISILVNGRQTHSFKPSRGIR